MISVKQILRNSERRYILQYGVLTLVIVLPLFWAFLRVRNAYPLTSWNVMMAGGEPQRGRTYFILRGETVGGDTIEIRPGGFTSALYGRTWGLVLATANNESFKLNPVHPANAHLLERVGGIQNLPAGARLPDLLEVWGRLYNQQQAQSSPRRLRAIRLDMYRWESGRYADYETFVDSWRKEF